MYENITYAELKSLPREQKPDAWKELKGMYSTQRELADKLGVSPNLVYNMVSRYARDENAEKTLEWNLDSAEKPQKARRGRKRIKQEQADVITGNDEKIYEVKPVDFEEATSFSIEIKRAVSGEDAQFLLNGIGNTLLKNQKYLLELKITESKAV